MKLHNDEEGVSETFGYLLILGIVVTGLMMVILVAASSIQNTKDNAQINQVGQAFTVADSRLSKARFSTSIFQESPFSLTDGMMLVNDSSSNSYINVTFSSLHGDINNKSLYNSSLGTVECVTNNGIIGYQDGGVWARYPNGGSIMISPPDFDYNGVTYHLHLQMAFHAEDIPSHA
jgi:hypothetical protein